MTIGSELTGFGLTVTLPDGWNGVVYQRDPLVQDEIRRPVMQASTLDVTLDQGDFGGGLVENLGSFDVFLTLLEIDPGNELALANPGFVRTLAPEAFAGNRLRRLILGQGGYEGFFTESSRAFCLYVVVGSIDNLGGFLGPINDLLQSIVVDQGSYYAVGQPASGLATG